MISLLLRDFLEEDMHVFRIWLDFHIGFRQRLQYFVRVSGVLVKCSKSVARIGAVVLGDDVAWRDRYNRIGIWDIVAEAHRGWPGGAVNNN
jgi:hypothetical protein